MHSVFQRVRLYIPFSLIALSLFLIFLSTGQSQDWFSIGINLGAPKIKMAVSDFPPASGDPNLPSLTQAFNQTLWNDLSNPASSIW